MHEGTEKRIRVSLRTEPEPSPEREEIPRIVRLLALANRWHRMIDKGTIESQAEIARMTGLTRARVMQIMSLRWATAAERAAAMTERRNVPLTGASAYWPHRMRSSVQYSCWDD